MALFDDPLFTNRSQAWLKHAEGVLRARVLLETVEDNIKEKLAEATSQLAKAQAWVAEGDGRRAQEARDGKAAEQREVAKARGQLLLDAQAAKERHQAAQKLESAKGETSQSTEDVIELDTDGEAQEAVRHSDGRCRDKLKRKAEEVEDTQTRTPSRRPLRRYNDTRETGQALGSKGRDPSGSRSMGGMTEQTGGMTTEQTGGRDRSQGAAGLPQTTGATPGTATLPIIRPEHQDQELRVLQESLMNLEARASALHVAQMEVSNMRNAALVRLGATMIRREMYWAEQAAQAAQGAAGDRHRKQDEEEATNGEGVEY